MPCSLARCLRFLGDNALCVWGGGKVVVDGEGWMTASFHCCFFSLLFLLFFGLVLGGFVLGLLYVAVCGWVVIAFGLFVDFGDAGL